MLQYRVKKKSGHASPKHGGERQPLTSSTMTSWLARTPFRLALCWTMRYLTAVVLLGSFNGPGMDSYKGIEPDSTVETKRSPAE